jgi:hypothetical protein
MQQQMQTFSQKLASTKEQLGRIEKQKDEATSRYEMEKQVCMYVCMYVYMCVNRNNTMQKEEQQHLNSRGGAQPCTWCIIYFGACDIYI